MKAWKDCQEIEGPQDSGDGKKSTWDIAIEVLEMHNYFNVKQSPKLTSSGLSLFPNLLPGSSMR